MMCYINRWFVSRCCAIESFPLSKLIFDITSYWPIFVLLFIRKAVDIPTFQLPKLEDLKPGNTFRSGLKTFVVVDLIHDISSVTIYGGNLNLLQRNKNLIWIFEAKNWSEFFTVNLVGETFEASGKSTYLDVIIVC